jgi:hypothetical protein
MDADPPSDHCEKALKQLTALILNVCSERLGDDCEVDVSSEGCTSTTIGDLISEIDGLILGGFCSEAAGCAAAVNEGDGLVLDGRGGSFVDQQDLSSEGEDETAPRRPVRPRGGRAVPSRGR